MYVTILCRRCRAHPVLRRSFIKSTRSLDPEAPKAVILLLVKRTALFFFFMSLLSIFLFLVGNAQDFQEVTQLSLLSLCTLFGALTAVDAIYGAFISFTATIVAVAQRGRAAPRLTGFFFYLLLGVYGLLVSIIASVIIIATKGNA